MSMFTVNGKFNCNSFSESLTCLPEELLLRILSYLSSKELCLLSQVNHKLYTLCAHDRIWKELFVRDFTKGSCNAKSSDSGPWKRLFIEILMNRRNPNIKSDYHKYFHSTVKKRQIYITNEYMNDNDPPDKGKIPNKLHKNGNMIIIEENLQINNTVHQPHSPTSIEASKLPLRKRFLKESNGTILSTSSENHSINQTNPTLNNHTNHVNQVNHTNHINHTNTVVNISTINTPSPVINTSANTSTANISTAPLPQVIDPEEEEVNITEPELPIIPIVTVKPERELSPNYDSGSSGEKKKKRLGRKKKEIKTEKLNGGTVIEEKKKIVKKVKTSESSSSPADQLYCVCRKPYDPEIFMIACDSCDEWYHGSCINLTEDQAADIKTYICQNCREDIEREENTADKSKKRKKTSSPEKKKCGNPTCSNSAAIGSKYCTYQCGIIVAKEQLKRKNAETQAKEEIVEDKNIDTEDTRTLRELRIKKQIY